MSWIVASLLNNRDRIRERAEIESDEFNDLLLIERAIESLKEHGLFSEDDLHILDLFEGDGYNKLTKLSRLERHTIAKKKAALCNRIAYYLGGYFTDEGYLAYIRKKYKLDSNQMTTLQNYIKSNKKNQIIRKSLNVN